MQKCVLNLHAKFDVNILMQFGVIDTFVQGDFLCSTLYIYKHKHKHMNKQFARKILTNTHMQTHIGYANLNTHKHTYINILPHTNTYTQACKHTQIPNSHAQLHTQTHIYCTYIYRQTHLHKSLLRTKNINNLPR